MRQDEILGLRWKDVDFEIKCLYVRQTLTHDDKRFKEGARVKQEIVQSGWVPPLFQFKRNRESKLKGMN